MKIFVVLSNHGVHHDCMGVFSKKEFAEDFLDNNEIHQGYIKVFEVIGEYTYPNDVYEANSYLGEWKVHTFLGLYANYNEAEDAAGEDGMVMPRTLDEE